MTLESFSQFLGLAAYENGWANGKGNDDHNGFPLKSLGKLEMEIVELLRSRNGNPISIASLPMLYYERYGRTLQAEGYLAESQRHGKAGYNLAKLLARLNNSICLIDRCTSISSFHFVYFPLSFNFTGQFQLDIYGFFYVTGLMGSIQ